MEPHVTNFYPYVRIMNRLWLPKVWFNTGFASGGVMCKIGALCHYSSFMKVDPARAGLKNPLEHKDQNDSNKF
jgi:hypothetical protein